MAKKLTPRIRFLQREIALQEQWIKDHGGTMSEYIKRYGSAGNPDHYGNGGEEIYHADLGQLLKLQRELIKELS